MADTMVKKLLELAGGPAERGYVLGLDSDLLKDAGDSLQTHLGAVPIVRPASELGLRRSLNQLEGAPLIALLPRRLVDRLPPDLLRRSRGGRVFSVEPHDALSTALGTQVVGADEDTVRLALDYISALKERVRTGTLPTVIDQRMLDELLLDAQDGPRIRQAKPGALLAHWIVAPPTVPAILSLLERRLPTLHGVPGRILAWAVSERDRLEALVVHGALMESTQGKLPRAVWGPLAAARDSDRIGLEEPDFRRQVLKLATEAVEALGRERADALIAKADKIAREQELSEEEVSRCRMLPLGLDLLLHRLARKAARGEPVSGSEIASIRNYREAERRAAQVKVIEELARLSRWLAHPAPVAATSTEAVRAYQEHGAFADRSVLCLRRALAQTSFHHDEARTVLAAWEERRNEENRAFAQMLAQGYLKALHPQGGLHDRLVPLHRVWNEVGSVEAVPTFLVVLDGCSYPVFLELLEELASEPSAPYGLVGYPPHRDRSHGIPALSLLPTITSHARGALFLGEFPKDPLQAEARWREEEERKTDPARFRQNLMLEGRSRKLFLKGDLADGGSALLAALGDSSVQVVAAVFNAVDDEIGSSNTGKAFGIRAKDIHGFIPSIERAIGSGRRVLVTADHGHTPFLGKDRRVGSGPTPRWCELGPGDEIPDGFIEVDLQGHGGTPGRKAFAWKVGAYRGQPQVGFHGGCGLEEMVVPLAWIGPQGVAADAPAWWYERVEPTPREVPVAKPVERRPPPRAKAPLHGDLFDALGQTRFAASDIGKLGLSERVQALLDEHDRAVIVLLAQVGSARPAELATKLRRPTARMRPFMTNLQRKLHKEGITLFRTVQLPTGDLQYQYVAQDGETRS